MVMADLGAEVISVESITRLSQGRGFIRAFPQPSYPLSDPGEHPWNRMAGLAFLRRNKLSIALDIATAKGRDIYLRLAAKSDVVINGMAGGVMERLGLGNEDLKAINPDIIVITLASFGDTGPYRDWTGTGNTVNAISSHNSLEGYKGESRD